MTPGPIGINSATYCGYTAVHNMGLSNTMAIFGSIYRHVCFSVTFAYFDATYQQDVS